MIVISMFTTKNHERSNIINQIQAHITPPNHRDFVLPKTEPSRTNIGITSRIRSSDPKLFSFWLSVYFSSCTRSIISVTAFVIACVYS